MCLLVTISRPGTAEPLLVGANRDERQDRPAVPLDVLQDAGPRIVGGRDLLAGGTWLAVSDLGVVAGLTNTPTPGGRDPSKRSRGGLPILAARQPTAEAAVEVLAAEVDPAAYNPAWMLVADRHDVFTVAVSGTRPEVRRLGPGVHVLENRPPGERSAKVRHVEAALAAVPDGATPAAGAGTALHRHLVAVLADHRPAPGPDPDGDDRRSARPSLLADCVHAEGYGTRWSALVSVGADPATPPGLWVADGPPCRTPFVDRSAAWAASFVAD